MYLILILVFLFLIYFFKRKNNHILYHNKLNGLLKELNKFSLFFYWCLFDLRNVSTNDDPSKPVTLIEFTIDGTFAVERAANLVKENNDFLVIGIVGTQGSG